MRWERWLLIVALLCGPLLLAYVHAQELKLAEDAFQGDWDNGLEPHRDGWADYVPGQPRSLFTARHAGLVSTAALAFFTALCLLADFLVRNGYMPKVKAFLRRPLFWIPLIWFYGGSAYLRWTSVLWVPVHNRPEQPSIVVSEVWDPILSSDWIIFPLLGFCIMPLTIIQAPLMFILEKSAELMGYSRSYFPSAFWISPLLLSIFIGVYGTKLKQAFGAVLAEDRELKKKAGQRLEVDSM